MHRTLEDFGTALMRSGPRHDRGRSTYGEISDVVGCCVSFNFLHLSARHVRTIVSKNSRITSTAFRTGTLARLNLYKYVRGHST
jgi:hypothetical protein